MGERLVRLDGRERALLDEARQVHVGILTPRGPHVTPELHALVGRELWMFTAAATLKARTLRDDPRVAVAARLGSQTLVLSGTCAVVDPLRPIGPRSLAALARAITVFSLRHAVDLAGFASDFTRGRLGRRLPPRRVALRVRPDRVALLEAGRLVCAKGDWPGETSERDGSGLPGQQDAAVGWAAPFGPLVLPARRGDEPTIGFVPRALVDLAALPHSGPACLVVDHYQAPGPAAKHGRLLRGSAELAGGDAAWAEVRLTPERTTRWAGVQTETHKVAP